MLYAIRMGPMILMALTILDVITLRVFCIGAEMSTSTDQKHAYLQEVDMCTNESEKGSGKQEPSK